jgi:hypothetical protein
LAEHESKMPTRQAAWEKAVCDNAWVVLQPTKLASAGGATLTKQPDGSVLASGKNPHPETYTVTANTTLPRIGAIRLEVLPDPSLPKNGPGRLAGNFVLSQFKVAAAPQTLPAKATDRPLSRAAADFSQESFPVSRALFDSGDSGWAVHPQYGKRHVAVFELKEPIIDAKGSTLTLSLIQKFYGKDLTLGKFRLSVATANPPVPPEGLPDQIAAIVHLPQERRTAAQKTELANYFRSRDTELARLQRELADHPLPRDPRLIGAQDLAWALINSPAFLFNH